MIIVRLTVCTLCLILVAAGVAAAQQPGEHLTLTKAALRLKSNPEMGSYDCERATQVIAMSYWRHANYEAAFAQIDTLGRREQGDMLRKFTGFAVDQGKREAAKSALNRALKAIVTDDHAERDWSLMRDFSQLAVEADELELASRFLDACDDDVMLEATLIRLAGAYATKGERNKAIALLDRAVKDSQSYVDDNHGEVMDFLAEAAKVFVTLGEKERAGKLVKQANELLLSKEEQSGAAGSQVALMYARLGDFSHANELVESLDEEQKARSFVLLAHEYWAKGDEAAALTSLLRARAMVDSANEDTNDLAYARHNVVKAYLSLGRPDDAIDVLRGSSNRYYLVEGAREIASSLAAKGRRQDATTVLDLVYSTVRKVVSEKSEDIPGYASFSKAKEKSQELSTLGEKYIEIGNLHGAEAAANEIDQPQYKASLLAGAAIAYAKDGDQSKAKSLLATAFRLSSKSESYNHDQWREIALIKIAAAYADTGFKEESANAILRLLRELRDGDKDNLSIDFLIEAGLMVDTKGIPLNRRSEKMLKQVVEKAEDN